MKVAYDDEGVLCVYSEDTGDWYSSEELYLAETLFYFIEAKNEGLLDNNFELTAYGLTMVEG
jgi:hypothetical protein